MVNEWSDEQGDSEPCFGVLQSLTRGLFESQPSGEWKTVVFYLGQKAGKTVSSLIGANGPSARRRDRCKDAILCRGKQDVYQLT